MPVVALKLVRFTCVVPVNTADAPVALGTADGFQFGAEFHSPPLAPIQVVWACATDPAPIRQPSMAMATDRMHFFMTTPPNNGKRRLKNPPPRRRRMG